MTKRERLHKWLLETADWVYLRDVPVELFNMSLAGCSTALRDLVATKRAYCRVMGLKQYKAIDAPAPKRGRGKAKLLGWSGQQRRTE